MSPLRRGVDLGLGMRLRPRSGRTEQGVSPLPGRGHGFRRSGPSPRRGSAFRSYDFRHTEEGEIGDQFDVIITSNCLEHFADPLSVMRRHLQSCWQFYVDPRALPRSAAPSEPRAAVRARVLPGNPDGFIRLASVVIDCGSPYWPGQQLLVIYAGHSHWNRRRTTSCRPVERELQEAAVPRCV